MKRRSTTPPRRFRLQFSLMTFVLTVTAVGVGIGLWMAWVAPLRSQWAAVATLREYGPRIETSASSIPDWMKWVLPKGQTENIQAVFVRDTIKLQEKDLQCFARLPYLKRLYLDRSNLDDQAVALLAGCRGLERLSLRNNGGITNKSSAVLAKLPRLQVVDVQQTGMNWRSLIEFNKRPQLKVIQEFGFQTADNSEIELMASFNANPTYVRISNSDETSVPRALEQFPDLMFLQLDRFEALNQHNLENLKSVPNSSKIKTIWVDLAHRRTDEVGWRSILEVMEAYALHLNETGFSIDLKYKVFKNKDSSHDAHLSLTGISPKDIALLRLLALFSTIEQCEIIKLKDPDVDELEFLGWLSNLETLKLYNCNTPKKIDFALLSRSLRTVDLEYCKRLTTVSNLTDFPNLTSLSIARSPLTTIENIDLPASTRLRISFPAPQDSVVDFGILKNVRSLGNLELEYCYGLTRLTGIESIPGLERLKIGYCSKLRDWDALTNCHQLKHLIFDFDFAYADHLPAPDEEFLSQLQSLTFSDGRSKNRAWEEAWRKIVAARENTSEEAK